MSVSSSATDTELFTSLRGGEASALDELFRRHYVPLCRTAIRLVRDPAAAEDIVQDFFALLWTKRTNLPSDTPAVGPYLRTAVRNRSLNYLRDRKRIPVGDGEVPETAADRSQQPAAVLENEELQQRINAAIDRLPERCRLVFVMSKLEHMSHREIADGLDISVKTVENQMTRAYKFLRQYLSCFLFLISLIHG
ncbi:RNA polymerase sigma-70 factor (ECF subfamily) [Neolewinella xylanilytica]|uniref:RNA polymerase sigma-70 factor (ECF subfamily) n=1 Tax=Neolewinella xylanilytica TaxID=1514080 RepID=A0A2S6I5E5_9BACT|nr:RNA polymerase sigma-70 factor [Neolewinella xylanilytica]PPK86393.1 RNA polymerase sigma-70 factor (ECF subfamily) [Neolewinella xylanilytica]